MARFIQYVGNGPMYLARKGAFGKEGSHLHLQILWEKVVSSGQCNMTRLNVSLVPIQIYAGQSFYFSVQAFTILIFYFFLFSKKSVLLQIHLQCVSNPLCSDLVHQQRNANNHTHTHKVCTRPDFAHTRTERDDTKFSCFLQILQKHYILTSCIYTVAIYAFLFWIRTLTILIFVSSTTFSQNRVFCSRHCTKREIHPLSTAESEQLFWLVVFKMLEIPISSSVYILELAVSLKQDSKNKAYADLWPYLYI